ncbi:MAG: FtsQ-type POTRA domain-containing protein [Gammaproteobacteria bacterium]|nr:FtsQ-type POTRA domain-containing protein [Gammaproteobacteria bacterium]
MTLVKMMVMLMKNRNKISPLKNIAKTLPVLFGVVAVFYVALLIKDVEAPVVLPVNDVQVKGELTFLDEEEIRLTVENNISGGYFTVDLNYVREILLQQPWVQEVSLRRQWPASVSVYVKEQKPVAYWNDEGYISETGNVFKPASVNKELNLPKPLNLPRLRGPEGQHNTVWKFMNVLYQKMAVLNYEVKHLHLDDRRAWQLVIASNVDTANNTDNERAGFKNDIDVRLGRFDTDKRMQRFVRILPALTTEMKHEENKNKIKVIDMRYPNGFAVQMSEA